MNPQNDQSQYVRKDLRKLLILISSIAIIFVAVEYLNIKTDKVQVVVDKFHFTTQN
jgi:hypothetical protein